MEIISVLVFPPLTAGSRVHLLPVGLIVIGKLSPRGELLIVIDTMRLLRCTSRNSCIRDEGTGGWLCARGEEKLYATAIADRFCTFGLTGVDVRGVQQSCSSPSTLMLEKSFSAYSSRRVEIRLGGKHAQ